MAERVVVALGSVDTDTVGPVLVERVTFVTDPSPDGLAAAEGVFAMAPRVTRGPRPLTDPVRDGRRPERNPERNAVPVGDLGGATGEPGAILTDCGRGGLLDPEATLAALESSRSPGVGPDVSDPEPARHHPLFGHPDVVLAPHLMGMTHRAMPLTFVDAARGVAGAFAGRLSAAVANPEWNHRKATV